MRAFTLIVAGLALAAPGLAGCAGVGALLAQTSLADQGQVIAQRRCAGCHAIGLDADPAAVAPPFRKLARRYDPFTLSARMEEISAHGSGEMPPILIRPNTARKLVAYFDTLR